MKKAPNWHKESERRIIIIYKQYSDYASFNGRKKGPNVPRLSAAWQRRAIQYFGSAPRTGACWSQGS